LLPLPQELRVAGAKVAAPTKRSLRRLT
jgi:hypothetical protein